MSEGLLYCNKCDCAIHACVCAKEQLMSEDKMRDIWAVADSVIETVYPNIYNLNKGMWGYKQIPNHGILRGAIAKVIAEERRKK